MSGVLFTLTAIVALLFVISIVVVVHELGHFWAARMFDTAIDRFSIGFGKPIFHWKDKQGVQWQVARLPLGGYVRFAGDENASSVPDQEDLESLRQEVASNEGEAALKRYFHFKPLWQRTIIIAAGPVSNFILAIAIFAVLAMTAGVITAEAKVAIRNPTGAGAVAGIRDGDVVRRMNGAPITNFNDLINFTRTHVGEPVRVEVLRDGAPVILTAEPQLEKMDDRFSGHIKVGSLGLQMHKDARIERQRLNPVEAVAYGGQTTWMVLSTTVTYLGRVITGKLPADQISSLLGIGNTAGKVAQAAAEDAPNAAWGLFNSLVALVGLAGFVSVSVGFMNLLPIPVLDGGHLVFYAYEAVARRPLPTRVQGASYRLGLALLLLFMLFATWNDLQRLRVFNFLGGLFS
jgi:regulator of sigma E protease